MLQELLACEVQLLDALLSQAVYNLCLGCNRCMVGTRNPACILAVQTCLADEYVLDGIVQHVTHVQYTCHIWWRDNDGVWLTAVRLAGKELVVQPVLIPFALYFRGVVLCCQFHGICCFKLYNLVTKIQKKL